MVCTQGYGIVIKFTILVGAGMDEVFPSKYLRGSDLAGHAVTVTITSPMADLKRLINLLTNSQLELFLSVLDQVCRSGYGEISFVISNGMIKRIRVTFSLPFPPVGDPTR